jgi:hypothetical protein
MAIHHNKNKINTSETSKLPEVLQARPQILWGINQI